MAIDKLGNYDLPLSDEERTTLMNCLGGFKTRDVLQSLIDVLAVEVPNRIHLSILYYKHNELDKIKAEIKDRLTLLSKMLQEQFPMIPDLAKEEYWVFDIEIDADHLPRVRLNEWLDRAITKGESLPVILSKVSDGEWIRYFNRYKGDFPELVKISPEMKAIIEYNEKLNDIADDYTNGGNFNIDFTAVIEEIIKATKEGKL